MFYIYVTTNLINGKKYIGQHKGDTDDNYLGSGLAIMRAVKKYGKENFKKDIICYCNSREELNEKERYYIDKYNAVEDDNYYNCMEGGTNGDSFKSYRKYLEEHPEEAQKIYQRGAENLRKWAEEHPEENKKNIQKFIEGSREWRKKNPDRVKEITRQAYAAMLQWREEHQEEYQKQVDEWRRLGTITNSKPVICLTTGKHFKSQSEAGRYYNVPQGNISKVLRGERKSAGTDPQTGEKLLWAFDTNTTEKDKIP